MTTKGASDMPLPKPANASGRELRERSLRDPQVKAIIEEIQRELSQDVRASGDGVAAEELPGFLRDHR